MSLYEADSFIYDLEDFEENDKLLKDKDSVNIAEKSELKAGEDAHAMTGKKQSYVKWTQERLNVFLVLIHKHRAHLTYDSVNKKSLEEKFKDIGALLRQHHLFKNETDLSLLSSNLLTQWKRQRQRVTKKYSDKSNLSRLDSELEDSLENKNDKAILQLMTESDAKKTTDQVAKEDKEKKEASLAAHNKNVLTHQEGVGRVSDTPVEPRKRKREPLNVTPIADFDSAFANFLKEDSELEKDRLQLEKDKLALENKKVDQAETNQQMIAELLKRNNDLFLMVMGKK